MLNAVWYLFVDSSCGVNPSIFKDLIDPDSFNDQISVIEYDIDDDARTIIRLIRYLVALPLCHPENTGACKEEELEKDPDLIDPRVIIDLSK